jgi:nitrogen fixation NifU-like protein
MPYGYSKKVMYIFQHPHNMGEMKDADAVGKVGNPMCGDLMWMFLKIDKGRKDELIIKDVKVKTFGCVAAIATSSVLTDLIRGKTLEQAMKITKQNIIDVLEGLPAQKVHCSVLAIDALKEAVYGYYKRHGVAIPKELEEVHQRSEKVRKALEHRH